MNFVNLCLVEEEGCFGILVKLPCGDEYVISSVCTRAEDARSICETVNRAKVSECHIRDVLEDLLP